MANSWHHNLDFSKHHQSKRRTFPTLYITGQRNYGGILTNDRCSKDKLWQEFLRRDPIKNILLQWQTRQPQNIKSKSKKEEKDLLKEIIPFRMVLHKTHRMKVYYEYSSNHKMSSKSNCQYFALVWIPCNEDNGLNDDEYNQLINAFKDKQSKYFCNKLNKESIYISGPKYGSDEAFPNASIEQQKESVYFNLTPLRTLCELYGSMRLPEDKVLNIEIVVHEIDRKVIYFYLYAIYCQ